MRTIAITQRLTKDERTGEIRDALDVAWARLFSQIGVLPVVLPSHFDPRAYLDALQPDGVLLSGGNSLSDLQPNDLSRARDDFEMTLIALALGRHLPLLGVCRGMQIIARYFGGRCVPITGHVAVHHMVSISGDSRYCQHLAGIDRVNSFHDYALEAIPAGFTLTARASDHTIEAIEHGVLPVFGQMWHPERDCPCVPREREFLQAFFADRGRP